MEDFVQFESPAHYLESLLCGLQFDLEYCKLRVTTQAMGLKVKIRRGKYMFSTTVVVFKR